MTQFYPGEDKLKQLQMLCRKEGIPLTFQRRVVFEALLEREDHPSVDQLYEVVGGRIPGVSKTTVYRILKRFVEMGLAREVHHAGGVLRFDAKTGHHHHLVCMKCNQVVDLELEGLQAVGIPAQLPQGFEFADYSIQILGICSNCRD